MLKEQAKFLKAVLVGLDQVIVIASFVAAYLIDVNEKDLYTLDMYAWLLLIIIPTWYLMLRYHGMYDSQRSYPISNVVWGILKTQFVGNMMLTYSTYVMATSVVVTNTFIVSFIAINMIALTMFRVAVRFTLNSVRKRGYNLRRILLVGTGESAHRIIRLVDTHRILGLNVVGLIQAQPGELQEEAYGCKVFGGLGDLIAVCKSTPVDEVIFCAGKDEGKFAVEDYIHELEEMGITARIILNLSFRFNVKKELGNFGGEIPLLTFSPISFDAWQLAVKRCLDVVGSLTGLVVTALLFPFIALAIRLDSPGPLFFGQSRIGQNGRRFTCWKFRSMYVDAEERKKELMHLNEMRGAIFKIKDDPRVTKVGKFLRKTSLDELPQFWNVFCGEMSLVGTRPPTPDEVSGYENWHRKRIAIKPGITGSWQVSGRTRISDFDQIVRLDLEYIKKWNVLLDLKLILRTFKAVVAREGA